VTDSVVLDARDVRKSYGHTVALDGVTLRVEAGEVVGLLGPNGAGKTTLVSIVAGIRRPDAGTVAVGGVDVVRHPQRAQKLIGFAPQDTGVYPTLTVRENLRFFAGLAGLRGRALQHQIEAVAHALGLEPLIDRRASELSGGERRRLHTAIALVHRPRLVLLDEPTTGADVRTRGEILSFVRSLAESGSAVVYSTHYLHEIEELDAHVVFIDHGRVVAGGALSDLVQRYGASALRLTFDAAVPAVVRLDGAVVEGATILIPSHDPEALVAQLVPHLGPDMSGLRAIEVVRPSLESVFLSVTGRRYDQEPVVVPA
jgi:ABC-2 type transport system ATP-binding protein